MDVGLVGLGRMGSQIRGRLERAGHRVVGYDEDRALSDTASLEELVVQLPPPRTVWVMVPAGAPTEATIATLAAQVEPGDLLVDGGNSDFRDSERRATELRERGLAFVDAGVSGGVHGGEHGFCLMVGGAEGDVRRVEPLLEALAAPGGWTHVGPSGAGHYTKMCHNAIEYAVMQAYAEGFALLRRYDAPIDAHRVAELWNHGSVIRSWLLELVGSALAPDADLAVIAPYVEDSGEGRWALREAVERGVATSVIAQSLFRRFESRDEESYDLRLLAALRREFGAHAVRSADDER